MKSLSLSLIIVLVLIFSCVNAQDGHYWSENYGNRSMLLSGTVNASVNDLGLVFYNPGRLGFIENPAFAISAKVYEWRILKIEDENAGIKLNNSRFGGAPSLAAGTFNIPALKNHRFAYSFLTRQRSKMGFFTRIEREGDLVDGLPGKQDIFNAKLDINTDAREEWIGLTWSPPSTKKISVGLSTFVSTANKNNLIAVDMNALNEFNQVAYYSVTRKYSYDVYSILWKLGMAINLKKIRMGLTLTTPRINIRGKGSALFEDYLVGVDTTGDGNTDDGYIFNNQDNLKLKYKSPWAIGFGLGIPFTRGVVHLSGEWYSGISHYTMMQIEPFIGQSTGNIVRFALNERLESVLNYGVGMEWRFNPKLSAYGSIAADYSAVPETIDRLVDLEETASNSIFQADFFHFGGGISIQTKPIDITVGASYEGGINEFTNTMNFPDEGDDVDGVSNAKLTFRNWRFIIGFSFPFARQLMENFERDETEK